MRSSEDELLDGSNLLSIVVLFERDELGLHVFDERVTLGALQLGEEFFYRQISMSLRLGKGVLTNHIIAILIFHHELQRACTVTMHCS